MKKSLSVGACVQYVHGDIEGTNTAIVRSIMRKNRRKVFGMKKCENCIHYHVCLKHEECGYYEPERPHGKWENGACTNCGAECFEDYYMRDIKTEFCHRCGADMRGEGGD